MMPGASNVLPVTFYFESLGEMDLARKRKGQQVRIFDSSGAYRFRVIVPSLDRAHRFMDAMLVMSEAGE